LTGTSHFNDLERGLPGISRALLSSRLVQLQHAGVITKQLGESGRQSTAYRLTPSGMELFPVLNALRTWGEVWAFGDPTLDELDPVLLMWWMRGRANAELLPARRIVAQFDFHGAATVSFWLVMTRADVTLCLSNPGFDVNVLVDADLATFYRLWGGRLSYSDALHTFGVRVDGIPRLVRAFPQWFGWSAAN
jgi:DNA-binding HxlR family transcriptional regulator